MSTPLLKKGDLIVFCGDIGQKHIDIVISTCKYNNEIVYLCGGKILYSALHEAIEKSVHIDKCMKCKWGLKSILEKCTHKKFEAFNG